MKWGSEAKGTGNRLAYVQVRGMYCSVCADHVRAGLLRVRGVRRSKVDREECLAVALYDPGLASPDELLEAVRRVGDGMRNRYEAVFLSEVPAEHIRMGWGTAG